MSNESAHPAPILTVHPGRAKVRGRRSRPLRIESTELAFVTSGTQDSVFFLHPLMCSRRVPANRQAARVIAAKRARLDARFARLIKRANLRRPDSQPQGAVGAPASAYVVRGWGVWRGRSVNRGGTLCTARRIPNDRRVRYCARSGSPTSCQERSTNRAIT